MTEGKEVIVLADMNEDVLAKDIVQFCKTTTLVEAITSLHGTAPVPTHQWGSKTIDGIFMSKTLLNKVRGGFLAFGEVMVSNHQALWVDIPTANLRMDQAHDITRPQEDD